MCSDSPDPPDYTAMAQANEKSAQIMADQANEDLKFRREQYATLKPYLQNQLGIGVEQARTQAQIAADTRDNALEDRAYYESTYKPVERASANDAFGYSYLSDADAEAFDKATFGESRRKVAGDYDSRLAALAAEEAAYNKKVEEIAKANPTIDRKAIEDELRKDYTYTREEALGKWVKGEGWWDGDYFAKGGQIPKTVVNKEGLDKAVQSRVDQLTKDQKDASAPIARDFAAERSVLERNRAAALSDEDAGLSLAQAQRKAQRAAEESAATTAFNDSSAAQGVAQQQAKRSLIKLGINPNSAKFASLGLTAANDAAAGAAASANASRTQLKDKLIGLRAGVSNFGRNQTNAAAGAFNTAVGAGATAANTAGAGVNNSLQSANYVSGATGNLMAAQQAKIQSNLGIAGLNNQAYQIAANQDNGFGQMLGLAGGMAMKFA